MREPPPRPTLYLVRFLLVLALLTPMACSDEHVSPPSPPRPPVLLSYLYPEVPYARRVDGAVGSYDDSDFFVSLDAMPNARSVSWTREGSLLFGHDATVVVDQAGVPWTWGGNEYGELGYEPTTTCGGDAGVGGTSAYPCGQVPVAVEALGRLREASGTCGILESGELECWGGRDASRQLLPPRIVPLPSPPVHVRQPYVVLADGTVWDGKGIVSGLPPIADISSVSFGPVCALARDGAVSCWGYASFGERGDEDLGTDTTTTPAPIHSPFRFTSISAGPGVGCGLVEAVPGRLACWGCGRHPEDCPQNLVPRIVPDLGQVIQVRAFLDTIYALESDGTLVALNWPDTSKRQVVR